MLLLAADLKVVSCAVRRNWCDRHRNCETEIEMFGKFSVSLAGDFNTERRTRLLLYFCTAMPTLTCSDHYTYGHVNYCVRHLHVAPLRLGLGFAGQGH
jgi:hypothetical protein